MYRIGAYEFTIASTPEDLEQVHRLNHQTFVEEIPQHGATSDGLLVDKFHDKNEYLICRKSGKVVGMLASHDQPPFSIADRLPDASILTQPGIRPVEIRLLAVEPTERKGPVLAGLVWLLYNRAQQAGYSHFVISGVVNQRDLYEHLGFEALGPAVGHGDAQFIPMWLPVPRLQETMGRAMKLWERRLSRSQPESAKAPGGSCTASREVVCLLPGPVAMAADVVEAFARPLVYHRTQEFLELFEGVRTELSALVGQKPVGVFVGSGTLGNEAVAATLAADRQAQDGIILINGEFGSRLARQAERWGLHPRRLEWDWGQPWDFEQIESAFQQLPAGGWVWGTHQETSTGVWNDLPTLVALAEKYGHRVCIDCISSLGTVPVDLSRVYLGTATSGKALRSYPGLAFVFGSPQAFTGVNPERVPQYLDIAAAIHARGPRFTVPSPLVAAMAQALAPLSTASGREARYAQIRELGGLLRDAVLEAGLTPLAEAKHANPSVVTFAPPKGLSADEFIARCREGGFSIAGQSGYLAERGLVQVAAMGHLTREQLEPFGDLLKSIQPVRHQRVNKMVPGPRSISSSSTFKAEGLIQ